MESLLEEMQEAIAAAVGNDPCTLAEMARPQFQGTGGAKRPKLFVLTRLPLNKDRIQRLLHVAEGTRVVVWPFFAAHVSRPAKDDEGRAKKGEWVHPQKLRTAAGAGLEWADYACRAIKIVQPRDILLLGGGAEGLLKVYPRRPVADHETRGRDYAPLVIREMEPFVFGKDKWPDHLDAWESKLDKDWQMVVAPHLKEHYYSGASVIPGTTTVNAQLLLKRERSEAGPPKKALKPQRAAVTAPKKVNAFAELMRDKRPCVGSLDDAGRDMKKQKF